MHFPHCQNLLNMFCILSYHFLRRFLHILAYFCTHDRILNNILCIFCDTKVCSIVLHFVCHLCFTTFAYVYCICRNRWHMHMYAARVPHILHTNNKTAHSSTVIPTINRHPYKSVLPSTALTRQQCRGRR